MNRPPIVINRLILNTYFARPAADTGSAFVAFAGTLEDILCAQEDRVVAGDNTVRYKNRTLQIPADRHRHHYVKAPMAHLRQSSRPDHFPTGPTTTTECTILNTYFNAHLMHPLSCLRNQVLLRPDKNGSAAARERR